MKIQVLDHGYVEFIEAWGQGKDKRHHPTEKDYLTPQEDNEVGIIEAARQSTQGSFRGWALGKCTCLINDATFERDMHHKTCELVTNPGDARLLHYLFSNNHATPFEFAGMVIEVQAPIFVFREWHRHRTQSYNEMSARYAPLPDLNYMPTRKRLMRNAGANKQAQGTGEILQEQNATAYLYNLEESYRSAQNVYEEALEVGVPKELARLVLPAGRYSKMRASANLRNWLQFIGLRADPAAQWEIQQFAFAVGQILKAKFPQTYALLPPSKKLFIEQGLVDANQK